MYSAKRHRLMAVFLTSLAVLTIATDAGSQAGASPPRPAPPPRTFSEFEGPWVLDEGGSTGRMTAAPGARVTFTITATEITLVRTRKLPEQRSNPPDETPVRQVYRLDGSETTVMDGRRALRGRFLLVADALVFTTSEPPTDTDFNVVTDAYTVQDGALIARRQLVAVRAPGYIATMQEPANNHPHTFVYRRPPR